MVLSHEPAVALVMPTFHNVSTLSRSVGSILSQTFVNWRLLIIDDASDDGTALLAQTLAAADERILVTRNSVNAGFVRNWRSGACWALREADCDFFALLDPEDVWDESWLATLVAFMEHEPSFGIAQSWSAYVWADKPKSLERRLSPLPRGTSVRHVFRHLAIGYGSVIHGLWRPEVMADVLSLSMEEASALMTHEDIFIAWLAVNHGIGIHPEVLFTKMKSRPWTKDYSIGDRFYRDFWRGSHRFSAAIKVERFVTRHLALPPAGRALFAWRSVAFMARHEATRRRAYNSRGRSKGA